MKLLTDFQVCLRLEGGAQCGTLLAKELERAFGAPDSPKACVSVAGDPK